MPLSKFFKNLCFGDKVLLGVGSFAAIAAGAILPSISLIMGNVAMTFTNTTNPNPDPNSMVHNMAMISAFVAFVALGLFSFSYMFFAFWQHLAENITNNLRKRYLAALMH